MRNTPQEFYGQMAVKTDSMHNKRIGAKGEALACKYLKKHGYKIVEKNYKNPFGEVDIIVFKDGVTAFVEVKTRLSDKFGAPSESVGKARQFKYIQGANFYFNGREIDCTVRFDIIEVFRDGINHIENAFQA